MPAVTVDLWHTLIYLSPADEDAYMNHQFALGEEVLRVSALLPGAPKLSDAELGRAFEKAYVDAVTESNEGRTVTPSEQVRRASQATGRVANPEEYLSRLRAEVDRTPFRSAPGAVSLLRALRSAGYHVGVISNTIGEPGSFLRPVLTKMGFDRYVEAYVFSDEHAWTKPAPEIFLYALEQVHERPEDAVHVGDGWSDLEGARRAGFRGSVLFTGLRSYGERYRQLFRPGAPKDSPSGLRVDTLREVVPVVRKLLPPG
jgi:HAD superfamily hydrolase (TIGR01509 family)